MFTFPTITCFRLFGVGGVEGGGGEDSMSHYFGDCYRETSDTAIQKD